MDMLYWAGEYIKVFLAYFAVMFVWPSVVFHGYLKKKSLTVRFAFCTTVQIVLINTVVLGLGLLHLLHGWIVALLFYGVFFLSILKRHRLTADGKDRLRRLKDGTYGTRLFWSDRRKELGAWSRKKFADIRAKLKGHKLEYLSLIVVVVFGMMYFSYGAFQNVEYGTSDMPVHHSWIYGLQQGKIFSDGIYPEAMHCFVYTIRVVFGIPVYSCELFLAGIHVSVLLISIFLFLKELFSWRGSAILALTLFLTVDIVNADAIAGIARIQWTIPQEFGLYTQFLCALFLVRYLKEPLNNQIRGGKAFIKHLYGNHNLFLFQMAFAASFLIHFYVTIMAFFLCVAVVIINCISLFRKRRILYLFAAVFSGLFISLTPMAVAYMEGIPLQGSLGWALGVMQKGQSETDTDEMETQLQESQGVEVSTMTGIPSGSSIGMTGKTQAASQKEHTVERIIKKVKYSCINKGKALYEQGYVILYTKNRAAWIVKISVTGFLLCILYKLITGILIFFKFAKNRQISLQMDGNIVLIVASVLFMMAYASTSIGIPTLIESVRLCSVEQILICAVMLVPLDMIFGILKGSVFRYILPWFIPLGVGGIYAGTQYLGIFHGYLFYNLSRYNEAVNVTNNIIQNFPEKSYTIVSPTDELYQVVEHGYHEELLLFSQKVVTGTNYTIPTRYLFLYVEKKPIRSMQYHFFEGPKWLASEKYQPYFGTFSSQGDDIQSGKISDATAKEPVRVYSLLSESYKDLESREVLESRAMEWCKNFQKRFPEDMKVYYEDDTFCCYIIRQNSYRLFQLEEK